MKKLDERAKDTAADPTAEIAPGGKAQTGISNTNKGKPTVGPAVPNNETNGTGTRVKEHVAPADFAAVAEMQKSILNFGQVAAGTDAFKSKPTGTGTQQSNTAGYLGGHDAVNSFIFDHYTNDAGSKAYVKTDGLSTKERQSSLNQNEIKSMRNLVETLQIIGSHRNGEYKADGIWGPRTNNAIKAISEFMSMIGSFALDMGAGEESPGFIKKFIADFRAKIPQDDDKLSTLPNKAKLAQQLSANIKAMTEMVAKFNQRVMENPSWASYISQDKPLLGSVRKPLNDVEKTVITNNGKMPLSLNLDDDEARGPLAGYAKLTLNDLQTIDSFNSFLKANNIANNTPEELGSAIKFIRERLTASQGAAS